jgi:hypothetical protein|nr:MAG TPA: Major capsid protein [Caudoviricetes sp.]
MANIELFKTYIDLLDEVYKSASVTEVLDSDTALVQAGANANEIVIPKISVQGLADYDRKNGYVSGDTDLTHETVKFNYDRGRKFTIDSMDNAETAGLAFGRLSSEFIRTKVAPEMDAYRFAMYAGTEGVSSATSALTSGNDVLLALLDTQNTMDENEVSAENRILFITPTLYNMAAAVDSYKSRAMLESFAQIVKVPQSRFYTAINLLDGKSAGEEAGGYNKADGASDINFMVVQKSAPLQIAKHTVSKIFAPEENQTADAWQFNYRAYGLADVYENKVAGIYLHSKPTA